MKTLKQIINQRNRPIQQSNYLCWDGWNYTGKGEKYIQKIESISQRYIDNYKEYFGATYSFELEQFYIPLPKEIYMKYPK